MSQLFPTFVMENDNLVREGLRHILAGTPFQPTFLSWNEADLDLAGGRQARVFIIIAQERERLVEQVGTLRSRFGRACIVVLLDESYRDATHSLFDKGANAALPISISPEGLIRTLQALISDDIRVAGGGFLPVTPSRSAEGSEFAEAAVEREPRRLSSREVGILDRIVKGDSNKHIARHFDIAEATVKAHVKAILRKIGAVNRTQAAIWSMNLQGARPFESPEEADCREIDGDFGGRGRASHLGSYTRSNI